MPKEAIDVLVFLTVVILLAACVVLVVTLLGDLAWCVENSGEVAHCMHYENNVYGKYVQPPLLLEDWVGRNECYSAEFR